MKPYKPGKTTCPKCGSTEPRVKYFAASAQARHQERLEVACFECGYTWSMACVENIAPPLDYEESQKIGVLLGRLHSWRVYLGHARDMLYSRTGIVNVDDARIIVGNVREEISKILGPPMSDDPS